MDLISIVSPYFKKRDYIKKTIESVQKQSYQNFEFILIYDDIDLSDFDYIKKLITNDERIKIFKNNENLGAGESRNRGINYSKGDYIAFLDSDDIWHEKKLETQLRFMKNNNHFISHTSYNIINDKDEIIGTRIAKNFLNYNSLLKSCDIGLSTVIIKREILNNDLKFPNLKTKEDFVLWLKLLKKKYKIISLDENLVHWRKLNNSLSSSIIQKLSDGFKVYNSYMNYNYITSLYLLLCLCINFLKKND